MVVQCFSALSSYNNDIIKNIYKTKEDIIIDGAPFVEGLSYIYRESILYDSDDYYHASYYNFSFWLSFKKYILISHFGFKSRIVDNKAWCPPNNVSISGCVGNRCKNIFKEESSNKYNTIDIVVSPTSRGVFDMLNFSIAGNVVGQIELFGCACDTLDECYFHYLRNLFTCKCTKHAFISLFFVINLITKQSASM